MLPLEGLGEQRLARFNRLAAANRAGERTVAAD
jgi:hypothetical protein